MPDRFPQLRSQSALTDSPRDNGRALSGAAPVDLTLLAALVLVIAVALV